VSDSVVVGYGKEFSLPFHSTVVGKMIEDVCERHVIDADPFSIEKFWQIIISWEFSQRSGTSLMGVLSVIEISFWGYSWQRSQSANL